MRLSSISLLLLICLQWNALLSQAQEHSLKDSLISEQPEKNQQEDIHSFTWKKMIVPAALITYGVLSVSNHTIGNLNTSTGYEINEHQPGKISADNYTQYFPAAIVYTLNLAGIKGAHNFTDRSVILLSSQLISAAIVLPLKNSVHKERPDGSNNHSFPSGHTATAFSTAHFMFREYRNSNIWLSISGYPFAVFTGVYRMLNNKHWLGDVAAGAGIGILSTEIAYWLQPTISRFLKHDKQLTNTVFYPYFGNGGYGIGLVKKLGRSNG